MKKLFLSAAMAVFSLGTFAQSAVGSVTLQPKVGLNIACLTDEDNATSRIGFTGGAELGYQATKKFAITGALMYSMQGAKSDFDEYNGTLKLDYINIPMRFLPPGNGGTEGGVKTIEEGLGEKVEPSLERGTG